MGFPIDDWQFWVATVAASLAVAWLVVRPLLRLVRRRGGRRTRATLTIEGRDAMRPKDRAACKCGSCKR